MFSQILGLHTDLRHTRITWAAVQSRCVSSSFPLLMYALDIHWIINEYFTSKAKIFIWKTFVDVKSHSLSQNVTSPFQDGMKNPSTEVKAEKSGSHFTKVTVGFRCDGKSSYTRQTKQFATRVSTRVTTALQVKVCFFVCLKKKQHWFGWQQQMLQFKGTISHRASQQLMLHHLCL